MPCHGGNGRHASRRSKKAQADDRSTRTEKFSDDCPRAGTSDI
jgi:hypothetical protein